MTDEFIVNLYWNRDEDAIKRTEEKYDGYLNKVSFNILADLEDCRECVNDTYLATWNSIPPHRPNNLLTYLGKIVRQISIDVFRKKNAQKRYASEYASSLEELGELFSSNDNLETIAGGKELIDSINRFLNGVSKEKRRLFVGRYFYFDSIKEVAGYCGVSETKAKSTLFRVRQQLKEFLREEGFGV
ncbi:MAG: RNA polymerase sigma factor [Clostridia bacterium]|nr:RNA polymerase sigma factor [Clostridia bacterium]